MLFLRSTRSILRAGDRARDRRDWPAARDAYRRALARDPGLEPIWVQYGHALKESGDPAAAEAAYLRALALDGRNADTHAQLGHLYKLLDRPDAVIACYAEALDLDPTLPHLPEELPRLRQARALALAQEGDLARERDDWPAARDAYRAALVHAPDRPELWMLHGEASARAGDTAEAANAFRRARDLTSGDPQAAMQVARALERLDLLGETAGVLGELVRLHPSHPEARTAFLAVKARLNAGRRGAIAAERGIPAAALPAHLRFVAFGTTGLCNASCIHCPTGKASTDHVPRIPMPMALFERIAREMADLHLTVTTQISLGLFGDGLVDPHVVERVRLLRTLLPEVMISVNTNGAAYNRERHRALFDLTSVLALHVESLDPATYDVLMQPLRAERVFPKVEQILEDFRGKVHVSIPVSRMNLRELPALHRHFVERGAIEVGLDGLSSRCAEDRTVFDSLALAPAPVRCTPEVTEDLIVDCDGRVLICCQDFQRIEPIGDLSKDSLVDVLLAAQRRSVGQQFATGRHAERQTCSRCYGDRRLQPEELGTAALRLIDGAPQAPTKQTRSAAERRSAMAG